MTIVVTQAEKGKFKVLVDYIQEGANYSNSVVANNEAIKIHKKNKNSSILLFKENK